MTFVMKLFSFLPVKQPAQLHYATDYIMQFCAMIIAVFLLNVAQR
jgi:hypothetical protein